MVYSVIYYKKQVKVYFPKDRWVGMNFQYGVGDYTTEWDTEKGVFKTSLWGDTLTQINMELTSAEADTIWNKMQEIEFFNYPDLLEFPVGTRDDSVELVQYTYEMRFTHKTKWLVWEKHLFTENQKAKELRELGWLIREIIANKPEFKAVAKISTGTDLIN